MLPDRQRTPVMADSAFLALYRTEDLAGSLDAWERLAEGSAALPAETVAVATYGAITEWLPAHKALFADELARENADRAQRALGDRIHPAPPSHTS